MVIPAAQDGPIQVGVIVARSGRPGYTWRMTSDPLALLSDTQSTDLGNLWYHHQPDYVSAYGLRKAQVAAVHATLMTRDWGTEEEPGPSLWTLRGLFGSLFKGGDRAAWIAEALEGQGPLPAHVAHVFTHAWKRQSSLRDLAAGATRNPEGAEAKLFKQLLVSMPDIFRWTCLDSTKLKGPMPEGMGLRATATPAGVPAQFNGEPYRSFLADLIKPQNQIAGWILDSVLALDPFVDYPKETRERSLVEIATHYRSDALLAYATRFMEAEGRMESQGVDVRDRTYPILLLRKRRYDELKASGVDIHHVDENGHTYFHHLAASWVPVGFKDGYTFAKEPADMEQDLEHLLAGWRTLVEMGADPHLPCTPTKPLRLSKSGNRKGWPVKWPRNQALPGETALQSLQRRATTGQGVLLPLDLVNRLVATLRDDFAQTVKPASQDPGSPRRPRSRS